MRLCFEYISLKKEKFNKNGNWTYSILKYQKRSDEIIEDGFIEQQYIKSLHWL